MEFLVLLLMAVADPDPEPSLFNVLSISLSAGYPAMGAAVTAVWRFMKAIRVENGERFIALDKRNQDQHEAFQKELKIVADERKQELRDGTLQAERMAKSNIDLAAAVDRLTANR